MKLTGLFLGALAALSAAPASGKPLFSNRGTLSGWSGTLTEHRGTVQQVSSPAREGGSALKMTQTYDASYKGRYHSEVHVKNAYQQGNTRYYGFYFRLAENWEFTGGQGFNLAQFIGNFPGQCDDWMPSTMIWIEGNQLHTRLKYGALCNKQQKTRNLPTGKTVTAGVWHKIVIQARWEKDSKGYFQMWYDGQKVVEVRNVATTIAENSPFEFRVGLYANSWHDSGYKGNQPFRQVWYDEIAFGDAFSDADPDLW